MQWLRPSGDRTATDRESVSYFRECSLAPGYLVTTSMNFDERACCKNSMNPRANLSKLGPALLIWANGAIALNSG